MLIERCDHRLCDVRKEVIDAEARAWERVHPIVQQQAAHDELEQEVGEVTRMHGMVMQPERHRAGISVDDHVHKGKEGDAAQLCPTELGQRAAILRREVGQGCW